VLLLAVEAGDVLPSRRVQSKCVPSRLVLDLAIRVGVNLEAAVRSEDGGGGGSEQGSRPPPSSCAPSYALLCMM
jgi:hypothetical protein